MLIITEVIFQVFYHFLRQKTTDVLVMMSEPYRQLYKWNYIVSSRSFFFFFFYSFTLFANLDTLYIYVTKHFLFIGPDFPFLEQLFLFFEHYKLSFYELFYK